MLSRLFLKIMIELCNKRRMVIFVFILGIISLLIIVAENKLTTSIPSYKDVTITTTHVEEKDPCWNNESFSKLMECSPCSPLQVQLNMSFCKKTGYSEKIRCSKSKTEAFISSKFEKTETFGALLHELNRGFRIAVCPQVGWMEARTFWTFESITLIIGLVSYGIVFYRQRVLDQLLTDKINKQIAAGI